MTMHVAIDFDRCQGHLRCAAYAPDVFGYDDDGNVQVVLPDVPPELADAVRTAVSACPERAISVHTNDNDDHEPEQEDR